MYFKGLVILFFVMTQICLCQNDCLQVKDANTNKLVQDYYIISYKNNDAKPFYSDSLGKLCGFNVFSKNADSLILFFNFQKVKLSKSGNYTKPILVKLENALETVVLHSRKQLVRIGPDKRKNVHYIKKPGEQLGILIRIDSITSNRKLEKILVDINKNQAWRERRNSNSSFSVSIFHSATDSLIDMSVIYRKLGGVYLINNGFKGWFELNVASENIEVPSSGYLIVILKVESGGVVINGFDENKNRGYKGIVPNSILGGDNFKSFKNLPIPAIHLILSD